MSPIDQFAVFGHPIKHSKSPRIHQIFAEQTGRKLAYSARDVAAVHFVEACNHFFAAGGKGLNCTVPLKELAWRYANRLTDRAGHAMAVNTLARQEDNSILGDNTDGIGLVRDLLYNHAIELAGKRILILGAGGAARGVLGPLLECLPAQIVIANRTRSKASDLVDQFIGQGQIACGDYSELAGRQFDLILNATSASLSGELPPMPVNLLAKSGCCYDLAYGNQPTAFVKWGEENHALKSLDGLGMLVEQAAEAFFVWHGIRPETGSVIELLNGERKANNPDYRY